MSAKKNLFHFLLIFFILIPFNSLADDYFEENENFINLDIETASPIAEQPNINARYAVVIDKNSSNVLFGKNENNKSKMASTTKIMTSIIVIENCKDLNEIVTISKKAARNRWFKIRLIHK